MSAGVRLVDWIGIVMGIMVGNCVIAASGALDDVCAGGVVVFVNEVVDSTGKVIVISVEDGFAGS